MAPRGRPMAGATAAEAEAALALAAAAGGIAVDMCGFRFEGGGGEATEELLAVGN